MLPLLHVTVPEQPIAVNVAFCVPQMLVISATICGAIGIVCVPQMLVISATICGAIGIVPLDICMLFEVELIPQLLLQVAV